MKHPKFGVQVTPELVSGFLNPVFLLSMEEYGGGGNVITMKETWWLRPSGDSAAPPCVDTLGYAVRYYAGYFTHGIRPAILVRDNEVI